jgi:tetratricopeptide (TPR) repeat protein
MEYETTAIDPTALDRRFIKFGAALCAVGMLALVHLINWGNSSLEVIPLKIKDVAGIASAENYSELADICMARGRYECVADSYYRISKLNPSDVDVNLILGDLERRLGNHSKALRAYDEYIRLDGPDAVRVNYGRGQSLAAVGEIDSAFLAFDKAILSKPDVIQTTVTEAYLELLIKNERYKKAKTVIAEARTRARKSNLFAQYTLPQ